jgi:hypothetical protein
VSDDPSIHYRTIIDLAASPGELEWAFEHASPRELEAAREFFAAERGWLGRRRAELEARLVHLAEQHPGLGAA